MIPNIDTDTANAHGSAVKDKVQAAASATRDAGAAIASDLKARATDTIGAARDAVTDRAGHVAEAVSDAGTRLAGKLRDVADQAEGEGFPARALHLVAGGLSDAAKGLSNQSISTLLADTRAFARRNPAIFVLGAAVAGFALMRLIKAGDSDERADATTGGSVRPELRNQPGAAS